MKTRARVPRPCYVRLGVHRVLDLATGTGTGLQSEPDSNKFRGFGNCNLSVKRVAVPVIVKYESTIIKVTGPTPRPRTGYLPDVRYKAWGESIAHTVLVWHWTVSTTLNIHSPVANLVCTRATSIPEGVRSAHFRLNSNALRRAMFFIKIKLGGSFFDLANARKLMDVLGIEYVLRSQKIPLRASHK